MKIKFKINNFPHISHAKENRYGRHNRSPIKILSWFLIIIFCSFIVYAIYILNSQAIIATNLRTIQKELINTILPLNTFLSRAAGNVSIIDLNQNHSINVKSSLHYTQQQKTYKLELLLQNPSYETIDCTGKLLKENTYPIKINLIWQPMVSAPNHYELICEIYDNFNQNNKKILLQHINVVTFRFLEHLTDEPATNIKAINQFLLTKTHNKKLAGIQIGMLIQSADPIYTKKKYSSYSIFNEKFNLIDRFLHKVFYITVASNLS